MKTEQIIYKAASIPVFLAGGFGITWFVVSSIDSLSDKYLVDNDNNPNTPVGKPTAIQKIKYVSSHIPALFLGGLGIWASIQLWNKK